MINVCSFNSNFILKISEMFCLYFLPFFGLITIMQLITLRFKKLQNVVKEIGFYNMMSVPYT